MEQDDSLVQKNGTLDDIADASRNALQGSESRMLTDEEIDAMIRLRQLRFMMFL
ncbi:hypothetical protein HDU96_003155, partial [Phlyctochytrium bullatum]